jgi:hypothetical protein
MPFALPRIGYLNMQLSMLRPTGFSRVAAQTITQQAFQKVT